MPSSSQRFASLDPLIISLPTDCPHQKYPTRNKDLIARLIKGQWWIIVPLNSPVFLVRVVLMGYFCLNVGGSSQLASRCK